MDPNGISHEDYEKECDRLASEIKFLAERRGVNPHVTADKVRGYITVPRGALEKR